MHVLDTETYIALEGVANYIALLRKLESINFPFSHRDCHGRTLAHMLSSEAISRLAFGSFPTTSSFSDIFSILDIDLKSMDNYGDEAGSQLVSWFHEEFSSTQWESIKQTTLNDEIRGIWTKQRGTLNRNISFRQNLASKLKNVTGSRDINMWIDWVKCAALASWVDIHGVTPLIALLKTWRNGNDELHDEDQLMHAVQRLVIMSPDLVDIRDRKGHTALAIAAIRGSEPSVSFLLRKKANPNSRNYRGKGIVALASKRMRLAKRKGDIGCWTRILICINLLADNGAKVKPTERDEWLLPELRGKFDAV